MTEELNFKYGISESVIFVKGENGLTKVILRHASGCEAEAYIYGGHVTSWKVPPFGELFFVSQTAEYGGGKAIRGGIPVIFPQFGGGELPSHGFARSQEWSVNASRLAPDGTVIVSLILQDDQQTKSIWPFKFRLELDIELSGPLTTRLRVTNTDSKPFSYQEALHTYFKISDISKVRIPGLTGLTYLDNLKKREPAVEKNEFVTFAGEVDRIYQNSPDRVELIDEGAGRRIIVEKQGMNDSVVWNPWIEKSAGMKDMHKDAYREMVCIESANTFPPRELSPGAVHESVQILSVSESSVSDL